MELNEYLKSLDSEDARKAFAKRCDTSLGHLRNVIYSDKKTIAPKLAVAIEVESGSKVKREDLRDDWLEIWPELKKRQKLAA